MDRRKETCIFGPEDMGPLRAGGSNMGSADAIKYQIQANFVMFFLPSTFRISPISLRAMGRMHQ